VKDLIRSKISVSRTPQRVLRILRTVYTLREPPRGVFRTLTFNLAEVDPAQRSVLAFRLFQTSTIQDEHHQRDRYCPFAAPPPILLAAFVLWMCPASSQRSCSEREPQRRYSGGWFRFAFDGSGHSCPSCSGCQRNTFYRLKGLDSVPHYGV
jgi:hypothetical protein